MTHSDSSRDDLTGRLQRAWASTDRGWRAATLAGLIVSAVTIGVTVPW